MGVLVLGPTVLEGYVVVFTNFIRVSGAEETPCEQ